MTRNHASFISCGAHLLFNLNKKPILSIQALMFPEPVSVEHKELYKRQERHFPFPTASMLPQFANNLATGKFRRYCAFSLFSDRVVTSSNGEALEEWILTKKLGYVMRGPVEINPNTGHQIAVFIWTLPNSEEWGNYVSSEAYNEELTNALTPGDIKPWACYTKNMQDPTYAYLGL